MSHVTTIEIEIRDLDALTAAAERCGMVLKRNQATYRWYGRYMSDSPLPIGYGQADLGKCAHAIEIKDGSAEAYSIGVVPRKDGKAGFHLLWDTWKGGYGLVERVGAKAEKLAQFYAVEVAKRAALRQGFRVAGETRKADGKIELLLAR